MHTDRGKGLHHLGMDESDAKGLEEAVGGNASCHVAVTNYLQVVVGPFGRHGVHTLHKETALAKRVPVN